MDTPYARYLLQTAARTVKNNPLQKTKSVGAPALDDLGTFSLEPANDLIRPGRNDDVLPLIDVLCARLCVLKLLRLHEHTAVSFDTAVMLQFHYQCALALLLSRVPEHTKRANELVKQVPWYPFGGFGAGMERRNRPTALMLSNVPWSVAMLYSIFCGFGCLTAMPLPLLEHAMAMLSFWGSAWQLPLDCAVMFLAVEHKTEPAETLNALIRGKNAQGVEPMGYYAAVNGFEVLFTVQCLLPFVWINRNSIPAAGAHNPEPGATLVKSPTADISCRELLRTGDLARVFGTTEEDECNLYLCKGARRSPLELLLRLCTRWFGHMRAPVLTGTSAHVSDDTEDTKQRAEQEAVTTLRLNEHQRQIYMLTLSVIKWMQKLPPQPIPGQALAGLVRLLASTVAPTARRLSETAALFARALQKHPTDNARQTAAQFVHGLCVAALAVDVTHTEPLRATALHFTEFLHVLCLCIERTTPAVPQHTRRLSDDKHQVLQILSDVRASKLLGPKYRLPPFCLSLARLQNRWPEQKDGEDVWLQQLMRCWQGEMAASIGALDAAVTYSLSRHGMLWHGGGGSGDFYADFQRPKAMGFAQFLSGVYTAAPLPLAGFRTDKQEIRSTIMAHCHDASSAEAALLICQHARGLATLATSAAKYISSGSQQERKRVQRDLLGALSRTFDWNWIVRDKDAYFGATYSIDRKQLAFPQASHSALLLPDSVPPLAHTLNAQCWFATRALLSLEIHRLAAHFGFAPGEVDDYTAVSALSAITAERLLFVATAHTIEKANGLPAALRRYFQGEGGDANAKALLPSVYSRMTPRHVSGSQFRAARAVDLVTSAPEVYAEGYGILWFYATRAWHMERTRVNDRHTHVDAEVLHISGTPSAETADSKILSASIEAVRKLARDLRLSAGDALQQMRAKRLAESLQWLLPDDESLLWDARVCNAVFGCALRRVTDAPEVDEIMLQLSDTLGAATGEHVVAECYKLEGRPAQNARFWQFAAAFEQKIDEDVGMDMHAIRSVDGRVFVAVSAGEQVTAFELLVARAGDQLLECAPGVPISALASGAALEFSLGVARNITVCRSKLVLAASSYRDTLEFSASRRGDLFQIADGFERFLADQKAASQHIRALLAVKIEGEACQISIVDPTQEQYENAQGLAILDDADDVFAAEPLRAPAAGQVFEGLRRTYNVKIIALPVRSN